MKRFLSFALLLLSLQAFGQTPFYFQTDAVNVPNKTASGSAAALSAAVSIPVGPTSTVGIQVTGTGAGFTLQPQASMDGGATWMNVNLQQIGPGSTSTPVSTITANGHWEISGAAWTNFQLVNTVAASSGTVVVNLVSTAAPKVVRSSGIGEQADTAATDDTSAWSLIALLKRLSANDKYAIVQTAVTVGNTSTQIIAANANRRYLGWSVVGTQTVTCVPGAGPAVVGQGFPYTGGGSLAQGSGQEFPHGAPNVAFQCIAPASGSIVYVWEGT